MSSVPLWLLLLSVIAVICVAIIVHRFWSTKQPKEPPTAPLTVQPTEPLTEQAKEELKRRCNLKIEGSQRLEGEWANQYRLFGRYDQWPPKEYEVWLITTNVDDGTKYWPQNVEIVGGPNHQWQGRVGLGKAKRPGEQMIAHLAIVGKCSQILIAYYHKTQDASDSKRKLPLWELPGMIECDRRDLDKIMEKSIAP